MTIQVLELQDIISKLMHHIAYTRGVTTIGIEDDLFWQIPEALAYNGNLSVNELVDRLEVGSIESDFETLRVIVLQNNTPLATNFRQAGHVLIAVARSLEHKLSHQGG